MHVVMRYARFFQAILLTTLLITPAARAEQTATGVAGVTQSIEDGATRELVARAGALVAKSMEGVTANDRSIDLEIVAGPERQSERNEATVISRDGEPSAIVYERVVKDRTELSSSDLRARERKENAAFESGKTGFRQPYDRRFSADYRFSPSSCPTCLTGNVQIAFRSKLRDDAHGDGSMLVEIASGRVQRVSYEPNVLPSHANNGSVTEIFGEPVAGSWTIVRIESVYSGRVALFKGSAQMTERLFNYRHYDTVSEALEKCAHASQQ
jgi:hypothetical protein